MACHPVKKRVEMRMVPKPAVTLVLILLAGLALRLHGIDYGLPHLYDFDEPNVVHKATVMLATRDFNPHWFGHPGTTAIYLVSVLYGVVYVAGLVVGAFANTGDFRALYYTDPTLFYLSGRILFAVIGTSTILLLYAIARRMFNAKTGLVAAFFLAVSPLHVYYSKLIRSDILMTFLVLVAFWFSLQILARRTWSGYVLAGFFAGLSIATKYPAAIVLLVIVAAYVFSRAWKDISKLIVSGFACLFGVFTGSPFLFLDFRTVMSNLVTENRSMHLSATGEGWFRNLIWYVQEPLGHAFSISGLLLAAIGVVLCLVTRKKEKWLLLVFPVGFLFFMASLHLRWERWMLPLLPFVGVLAALAFWEIVARIGRYTPAWTACLAGLVLLLSFAVPLLKADRIRGCEMSGKDTRTIAREWILEHLPKGSRILLETYGPELPPVRYTLFVVNDKGSLVEINPAEIAHTVYRPFYAPIGRLKNVQAIHDQGVEYMVLSHFYDRFLAEKDRSPDYAKEASTYEALMNRSTKVYEIHRVYAKNSGPSLRIYRFHNAERLFHPPKPKPG